MKKTIEEFEYKKEKSLKLLKKLQNFLYEGKKLDIEIDSKMFDKINNALSDVKNEKLKVALIGGFSEGKTSIAAAWLEKYDKNSMKISQQESSDEVKIYDVDDKIVLIDTPGLFGFKETEDKKEKYKEITKKYVSEAHIVLYVMNSTNSIKESHKEDLKWLYRTLNLLPRTIFVLSRFDEVADIEDEIDYQYNLKIKKENVIKRLKDTIDLSEKETEEIMITGVSANPFDQGIQEYWLENLAEYKKLSKIETLQKATTEIIEKNQGISEIILETEKTIIKDIMEKEIPIQEEKNEILNDNIEKIEKINNKLGSDLKKIENKIINTKEELRNFLINYFSRLIKQNEGTSIETFNDFYQIEIGKEGIIINERVKSEFEKRIKSIENDLNSTKLELNAEIKDFNNTTKNLGEGIKVFAQTNPINNIAVLGVRDGIVNAGKFVGQDIGKFLKFKPWGATNLAKGLNGILAGVGFVLELSNQVDKQIKLDKFEKNKKEITKFLENFREDLLNQVNSEEFINKFSDYINLKKEQEKSVQQIEKLKEYKKNFSIWYKNGQEIMRELNQL